MQKKYSVEIFNGPSAIVTADSPKKAVKVLLNQHNYDTDIKDILGCKDGLLIRMGTFKPVKVCLLGGTRESVSWYSIKGLKSDDYIG